MGYRARWLAVKNGDLGAALQAVRLRKESESHEAVYDPGHFALNMPGGWLVVIGDGHGAMDAVQPAHAQALSAGTEALHFYCDDTPMCASLAAYRDGKETWRLEHGGATGVRAPTISGAPPPLVAEVVERLQTKQRESGADDVDYLYEAAPEIGRALTGFRHDQTLPQGTVLPIVVLGEAKRPLSEKLRASLKRLFS